MNYCRVIEVELSTKELATEVDELEDWICKVLYIISERQIIRESKNAMATA